MTRALASLRVRWEVWLARALADSWTRLDRQAASLGWALPDLPAERRRLAGRVESALRATETVAGRARERLAVLTGRLPALSPHATLERGFALVERPDGSPVGSAVALRSGDRVDLRLRDGRRPARIEPDAAPSPTGPSSPRTEP